MFTITETMGMAIIAPRSACEFGSSEQAKAAIQAAAYIGNIYKTNIRVRRYVYVVYVSMFR